MKVGEVKAMYMALGHTAESFENPDYMKVLKYGLNLVSERDLEIEICITDVQ